MASLTSLPCELLEEIFHQLNQHYTLALAPLHSKLYYIAKPKLYRNIYVYTPWPIIEYGVESNEQGETFHISKNLNNFKGKKYSIISSDTLERYLAKMDKTQEIYHLELYGHNMTIVECILRHFSKIRYFQLVVHYGDSSFRRREPNYIWLLQNYIGFCPHSTVYIAPSTNLTHFPVFHDNINSIQTDSENLGRDLDRLHRLKNVTKLAMLVCKGDDLTRYRWCFKLQVLEIIQSSDSDFFPDFLLSDAFETVFLKELTLFGDFNPGTVFKSNDLEEEFPKLQLFCLQLAATGFRQLEFALQDWRGFKHSKVRYLILSSRSCLTSDVMAVCDLLAKFPNSSVNWWYQSRVPFRLQTHKFRVLSPDLPFGIIGYHFYGSHYRDDLTNFRQMVTIGGFTHKTVEVKLEKYYTEAELYTIYKQGDGRSVRMNMSEYES
ncbi:hypothetical protein I9W82_003359 [Candida metapsilosis]|uniref:F-box domain-containing protein n=1 Tax=Candida metapsilosis TaxID=273372 RepID=A0A8H7ZGK9_9ASCO|nr:hypothetical protein I9W82_003359 [Candida metapsilosis]